MNTSRNRRLNKAYSIDRPHPSHMYQNQTISPGVVLDHVTSAALNCPTVHLTPSARLNGDWSEYKVGEEVEYVWNGDEWKLEIEDEDGDLNDGDLSVEELKEFVGEGICVIEDSNEDLWYNIKFEGEDLVIGFEELDIKF